MPITQLGTGSLTNSRRICARCKVAIFTGFNGMKNDPVGEWQLHIWLFSSHINLGCKWQGLLSKLGRRGPIQTTVAKAICCVTKTLHGIPPRQICVTY